MPSFYLFPYNVTSWINCSLNKSQSERKETWVWESGIDGLWIWSKHVKGCGSLLCTTKKNYLRKDLKLSLFVYLILCVYTPHSCLMLHIGFLVSFLDMKNKSFSSLACYISFLLQVMSSASGKNLHLLSHSFGHHV